MVAQWCPDASKPEVPKIILDSVVAIPCADDPGQVLASGPGDATAAGEMDKMDADVEALKFRSPSITLTPPKGKIII